jgi:superfamily II DNA or RNA helicase
LDKPRGVLKAPTGTGKTVLGFGCLSAFDEDVNIIWLCHTKDLIDQAYDEAVKFGHTDIGRLSGTIWEPGHRLTIATKQSFKKIADEQADLYDVVVVDETHHVSAFDGEYHYILSRLLAPMRLGLTASEFKEGLPTLAVTGLIGPIVGEQTILEAIDLGILAVPKMKMLRTSLSYEVKACKKYSEVYDIGITYRLERNQLIALTVKKHVDIQETCLIMVTKLAHGDNIVEALRVIGVKAILVEGLTKPKTRKKIKDALNTNEIFCVVCSTVWKEGINIPNLKMVLNAAVGKDVLQALGRGLRKTSEKDVLWFYDIFDNSHHYLVDHFGQRLTFYMDQGWI